MTFRNIPRELNAAADHMCRVVRHLQPSESIRVTPASHTPFRETDLPKVDLQVIYHQQAEAGGS